MQNCPLINNWLPICVSFLTMRGYLLFCLVESGRGAGGQFRSGARPERRCGGHAGVPGALATAPSRCCHTPGRQASADCGGELQLPQHFLPAVMHLADKHQPTVVVSYSCHGGGGGGRLQLSRWWWWWRWGELQLPWWWWWGVTAATVVVGYSCHGGCGLQLPLWWWVTAATVVVVVMVYDFNRSVNAV